MTIDLVLINSLSSSLLLYFIIRSAQSLGKKKKVIKLLTAHFVNQRMRQSTWLIALPQRL